VGHPENPWLAILPALICALAIIAPGVAHAHGGGPGLGYDQCIRQTGVDDFIHLGVYQPEFNPFAEYCGTLPKAGRTLLVFDFVGAELPRAQVSLEVLAEEGGSQLSVPARRYDSGIANLAADLAPGKYSVVVSIDEPGGNHRFAFPLAVGGWWARAGTPVLIILFIVAVTIGYCTFQVKRASSERLVEQASLPAESRAARHFFKDSSNSRNALGISIERK
jgi:hypothetical protein